MSIELIIGVILGSIPVILETYDRSYSIVEVLISKQGSLSPLRTLRCKFHNDKVIFRASAIKLQDVITKRESDIIITQWVHLDGMDILGELLERCKDTIEKIDQALNSANTKMDNLFLDKGKDDVSRIICSIFPSYLHA